MSYLNGCDILGADTIPTVGQNYNKNSNIVYAVQAALTAKGFDPKGIDGIYGKNTAAAIKKLQASIDADTNGNIDEGVLAALGVSASTAGPPAKSSGSSYSSSSSYTPTSYATSGSPLAPGVSKTSPIVTADGGLAPWKIGVIAGGGGLLLLGVVLTAVRR